MDEPRLGHHMTLRPTASRATLLARRLVRGHTSAWSPNTSVRRPQPGSAALGLPQGEVEGESEPPAQRDLRRSRLRVGGGGRLGWLGARQRHVVLLGIARARAGMAAGRAITRCRGRKRTAYATQSVATHASTHRARRSFLSVRWAGPWTTSSHEGTSATSSTSSLSTPQVRTYCGVPDRGAQSHEATLLARPIATPNLRAQIGDPGRRRAPA